MDGYYDQVETQLRALTERGAHRRARVRATPIVTIAATAAVVVVVAGVFLGARGRGHSSSPGSPATACTGSDWRMARIPARQLDGATVAGVSISATTSCRLHVAIAFDLVNRSGAVASAVGASVNSTIARGASVERRWAWRNAAARGWPVLVSPEWGRADSPGSGLTAGVRQSARHDRVWAVRAQLARCAQRPRNSDRNTRSAPAADVLAVSNLLGVFGDHTPGRGCGVDRGEHMLDHIDLFFGQGRFVGYEYSGHFLTTTAGLRVGDTIARARRIYGAAFKPARRRAVPGPPLAFAAT